MIFCHIWCIGDYSKEYICVYYIINLNIQKFKKAKETSNYQRFI